MATEKTTKQKLEDFLNEKNYFTDALGFVETKTGVNRIYLFGGCLAFLAFYLVVGYASGFVVALLGFLYPAYASVKAIESTNKEDDTQWLTYWVVYAGFSIVEFFSDIFLSWFPLYFLFKCAFLGWCMAPFSWNGSQFLYTKFIAPFVLKNASKIDAYIDKAEGIGSNLLKKAEAEAKKAAMESVLNQQTESAEPSGDKKED